MTLIEQARLTLGDEVPEWMPSPEESTIDELFTAIAEAQLEKALRTVVEVGKEMSKEKYTDLASYLATEATSGFLNWIEAELEASGLERPKGGCDESKEINT